MVSKIRDWLLKTNPRYATALLIFSACLLFMPQNVLSVVHVSRFAESYRPWIYLVFFTSAAILLMYPVHNIWGLAVGLLSDRRAIQYAEKRLNSLTNEGVSLVVGGERRLSSFYATCFFSEV